MSITGYCYQFCSRLEHPILKSKEGKIGIQIYSNTMNTGKFTGKKKKRFLSLTEYGNSTLGRFSRICVSVCVSVQAITFEPVKLGTSFSVHHYNI